MTGVLGAIMSVVVGVFFAVEGFDVEDVMNDVATDSPVVVELYLFKEIYRLSVSVDSW